MVGKMTKKYFLFLLVFIMLFSFAVVNAKEVKREWQDKNFDVKKIRTILIMPTTIKGDTDDKMLPTVLNGMITERFNDKNVKNNIHFIMLDDAYSRLNLLTGEDLKDLKQSDINKFNQVWNNNIAKICDAILVSETTSMGTEIFTYKKIVNKVITYDQEQKDSNDNSTKTKTSTLTVPVEQTVTAERVSAGLEFTLQNAKTLQPIWYILDSRDRENDIVGMTSPEDMFKRITERAFDRFQDLF